MRNKSSTLLIKDPERNFHPSRRLHSVFEDRRCQPLIGAFGSRILPSLCDRRHRHAEIWPRVSVKSCVDLASFFACSSLKSVLSSACLLTMVSYHAQKTVAWCG